MVIVKIIGGLGNQLFQYAAARRLAHLHQTSLRLDITPFKHYRNIGPSEYYKFRAYGLKPFRIQEAFATPEEIEKVIKGTSKKGLARIVSRLNQKLNPYYRWPIFSETHLKPFDPSILKTPKDVYLDGYWQSEKYFAEIRDVIQREFTIKFEQNSQSLEIAERIANTQSVSIHVRRGDYVLDPETNRFHVIYDLAYYKQCVSLISEKVTTPHFFVFSDDPSWGTDHLRLDYPTTFVVHNDATRDYEDLRLMSMCKHNIIANSTFSWWAAWLNTNPYKIVLAPREWFKVNYDTRDLLPDNWIKV
jgi:hypothetical protein